MDDEDIERWENEGGMMTTAWFAWNMMNNGWRDDDERREREERNMAGNNKSGPLRVTPLDPTPYASGGSHNYNFEPRSEMKKFKVYLKSGTVLTIAAEEVFDSGSKLIFRIGSDLVGVFFEAEGYQYLRPVPKEQEKSGS